MTQPISVLRAAVVVLALSPVPAAAFELTPPVSVCAVAAELKPFLERATGYTAEPACPDVSFTLPVAQPTGQSRAAEYDFTARAIRLASDIDLTTVYGQSVLLHEMVHAAQHASGLDPDCRAELEYEAYATQAAYLTEHGAVKDARIALIYAGLMSSCGPRYRSTATGACVRQKWITRSNASSTLSCIISDRVGCGKTVCIRSSSVVSGRRAIT